MGLIPLQRLYHINVVVHDLRMTVRNYARIFGITHWEVRNWTPDRLSRALRRGSLECHRPAPEVRQPARRRALDWRALSRGPRIARALHLQWAGCRQRLAAGHHRCRGFRYGAPARYTRADGLRPDRGAHW